MSGRVANLVRPARRSRPVRVAAEPETIVFEQRMTGKTEFSM